MIKELAEFGKRIRTDIDNLEDALEFEHIDLIIEISKEGAFRNIYATEKDTRVEDVIRTEDAGRTSGILPRLLVDNAQYVLGFPENKKRSIECNQKFVKKLYEYLNIKDLEPVFEFYQKESGLKAAYEDFSFKVKNKQIDEKGNIAFLIADDNKFLHENTNVYKAIIEKYKKEEALRKGTDNIKCSVCGETDYRTKNVSVHGVVKRVPDGQPAGCSLISYNADSFESYGFKGNDNSTICTHCIKNYIIGLNWLLNNGSEVLSEQNGKTKPKFMPTNRKNFGSDTAMVFWTREPEALDEMNWFDKPDAGRVANLIESVANAQKNRAANIKSNQFYSLTLSGAAARIAIRDWIEISLDEYKQNIAKWFEDTAIRAYGEKRYFPLYVLARAGHNTKSDSDPTNSRIATQLWNAALKNTVPSLWILNAVLKRIRFVEQTADGQPKDSVTPERAALLRFVLNRNNKNGGYMIKEQNDPNDKNSAIICGKIFAVMESIQRAALGKEINAGIRERFFSFVSTSPAPAFGRLMKLSQNHISKLKHEKPGLAIILDKQLQELCSLLNVFPPIFSLEEQGQFALGYYHQKQEDYDNYKNNKEMQSLIENYKEE